LVFAVVQLSDKLAHDKLGCSISNLLHIWFEWTNYQCLLKITMVAL